MNYRIENFLQLVDISSSFWYILTIVSMYSIIFRQIIWAYPYWYGLSDMVVFMDNSWKIINCRCFTLKWVKKTYINYTFLKKSWFLQYIFFLAKSNMASTIQNGRQNVSAYGRICYNIIFHYDKTHFWWHDLVHINTIINQTAW